ncbi:sodium/potassium-transporting ATPase subunit beta-2-like [Anopheles aquasalis]|uniref:sodium/potassium-transporting ATPase subunit beta-2-like n=1 Tax=Anopheles aquasalis TaxID=42839 RepID=UPI00215B63BC|nr:sodium/potassium-transporting ATPase subunit beta-2-like [Anopheles aquasalis]XP_050101379.1 sodium/potassium-transporting ATPase subunit beta-2-like [Anopheles aquasalis]XP_050101380.1 sodium/potassium-transporting ATPase subunit beta-2-like [Anopheles aquasalis]
MSRSPASAASAHDHVRMKPEPVPFSKFLFNSQNGTVLGRTAGSWAKIGTFYIIFYTFLAALVAFCMWVFLDTLDPRIPKWQVDQSLIGNSPGLSMRPLPFEDKVEKTQIVYKGSDMKSYKTYTDALDDFLSSYRPSGQSSDDVQVHNCSYNEPPPKGKVCEVDIKQYGPCTQENHYSYHKSAPCIFLKLNKIYGWEPVFYDDSSSLPSAMPSDLKEYIKDKGVKQHTLNTVWVSCEGESEDDRNNIGPIQFYPRRGFPGYYYPFENTDGYLSPLVAVRFERPARDQNINVECKAWARNIKQDRYDRFGLVRFELKIES